MVRTPTGYGPTWAAHMQRHQGAPSAEIEADTTAVRRSRMAEPLSLTYCIQLWARRLQSLLSSKDDLLSLITADCDGTPSLALALAGAGALTLAVAGALRPSA